MIRPTTLHRAVWRIAGPSLAVAALALATFAVATLPAAAKDAMKAPGSRIAIALPDGFEVSKLFSGFLHPNARASIVIAELPTTRYDEIVAGMTDEALAAKGITDIKRSKLERPDEHQFFTGQQMARGEAVAKFVLLVRSADTVAVITANVPKQAVTDGDLTHDDIVNALTSAKLTDTAAPVITQFTVPELGRFKEAGKIMGSAVLYTLDGVLAPKVKGQTRSVLIISPSIDELDISGIDLKAFSNRAFDSLGGYDNVTTQPAADVTIDNMKGVRQTATAVASESQVPVALDQIILVRPGGGYFRLLAVLRQDEAAGLAADIERIFTGFKAVRDGKAR